MTTHNTFGWEIAEKPIYANNAPLKGYKAIFRNDNQQLLNVAKQSYTPTPNTRFVEVVERLTKSQVSRFVVMTNSREARKYWHFWSVWNPSKYKAMISKTLC